MGLLRGRKQEPSLIPWTPPPAYELATMGHKTMYLAEISVGEAGQTFRLLVDTGSPLVVLPGSACAHQGPRFDDHRGARPGNRTANIKFGIGEVKGRIFQ